MKEINERPVCHRAEDLVTYLYDEANEAEARDFANHAEACDACRAELAVFKQVHESISLWRNEALGAAFNTAVLPAPAVTGPISIQTVRPERRLSAPGALRKFFSVSPLWLRAATAFAALMFCVLAVLAISRSWNKPPLASNQPKNNAYSQEQFDTAVANEVKRLMDERKSKNSSASSGPTAATDKPNDKYRPPHLAMNRTQPKVHPRGLSRQERVQLAADLRLIPRDEDELPFVFSEEPNQ
jgi:hypothetical protein